jgi:hypothetical protein
MTSLTRVLQSGSPDEIRSGVTVRHPVVFAAASTVAAVVAVLGVTSAAAGTTFTVSTPTVTVNGSTVTSAATVKASEQTTVDKIGIVVEQSPTKTDLAMYEGLQILDRLDVQHHPAQQVTAAATEPGAPGKPGVCGLRSSDCIRSARSWLVSRSR